MAEDQEEHRLDNRESMVGWLPDTRLWNSTPVHRAKPGFYRQTNNRERPLTCFREHVKIKPPVTTAVPLFFFAVPPPVHC